MLRIFVLMLLLLPMAANAAEEKAEPEYGVGVICPHTDTQVTFYTENNQQDAAGTIAYETGGGFIITSDSVKDLESAGAKQVQSTCEGGVPGIRIEAKRDGWLKAGKLWLPPNQEWDYGDWADYLRKTAIWKPLGNPEFFQGGPAAPDLTKTYLMTLGKSVEIYPLKFSDDNAFSLVLLDENGAFDKGCAGSPTPPRGRLVWMRLSADSGTPYAMPVHTRGCPNTPVAAAPQ